MSPALIEVAGPAAVRSSYAAAGRLEARRDEVVAVHDLTFAVDAGEMVGYIGPNGAGQVHDHQDAHRHPGPTAAG